MLSEAEEKSLERSDLIIEGNTATWDLRLDGDIHGTYTGAFRFKCYLSPLQQIAADRERRELLGNQPLYASDHESFLAYALTQLKYRIVTAPPFWASSNPATLAGDIADENVIAAVLDAALGAEIKYKSQLKKKKLDAIARAKASTEKLMTDGDDEDEDEDESESQEG
ncbi:MAG: hypothetical protein HC840_00385 [Leptolyngbyaceae cyanobacterium RM2_2_4]|nr:hypothetical protein [Leptolyngbyaceae cyanobacterium RM2_2_4]